MSCRGEDEHGGEAMNAGYIEEAETTLAIGRGK